LGIVIDRPRPDDWPRWRHLYQGYAEHYRVPMDDAIAGRLWAWINDPAHPVEAFVARNEGGTPVGLAHYRAMPRPLGGNEICFLDDLFVDPAFRGGRCVPRRKWERGARGHSLREARAGSGQHAAEERGNRNRRPHRTTTRRVVPR